MVTRSRVTALLIIILFTGLSTHLPGLDEFRDAVEEERSEAEDDDESDEESDNDEESDDGDSLGAVLVQLTVGLWHDHNRRVTYGSYPYDPAGPGPAVVERNFIYNIPRSPLGSGDGNDLREREKGYWFEISAAGLGSGFPAPPTELNYGGYASLQGRIVPHIGPDLDTRVIVDGKDQLWISGAGVDISIAQHDYFGLSMYGKAAFMRGVLDLNGAAAGLQLRSYPFAPLSVQLRGGAQQYDGVFFWHGEGRLNVHFGRFALFAGGMLLQSQNARLHTVETGLSITF